MDFVKNHRTGESAGLVFCVLFGVLFFAGGVSRSVASDEPGFFAQNFAILPAETAAIGTSAESSALSEAFCSGDSLAFSQDVVLRGGLGLPSCRSIQIWGNYYIGSGEINPKDTGREIDNDVNGAMIGLNLGLGSAFILSGYYNYDDGEMTFPADKFQTTTHLGGVGIQYDTGGFYFTLIGNYGISSHELSQAAANRSLEFDGWQAAGFFETGYNMSTGGGLFSLKPFANFQYNYLETDSFNRADLTSLDGTSDFDAFYQTLGSRVNMGLGMFDLQGRLAWVHQYLNVNAPIQNFWFGRVPGTIAPTRVFYEGSAGRDYFWGGAGLKMSLLGKFSVSLDYDCLLNKYQTTHVGSAGILWAF